ncbi:MAG TPA: hemolysin III family protein [Sedimenticola sp.]|nr:hemolysin III family protein [Sedimenticola sp.]
MYHGERFNSISHLVGAIAAAAGLVVLVYMAVQQDDPWKIVSFTLYSTTLFLLFLISTLYHSLRGRAKAIFQKLDHFAIYLLIAGSYTPFTLITLDGAWGWSLFGSVWGLAVIGIIVDALGKSERRLIPMIIYLLMGWSILVAIYPLSKVLPAGGMVGLVAGGLFYTVGIFFYVRDEVMRHAHGIWHLFVLAGSACHYATVAIYVA